MLLMSFQLKDSTMSHHFENTIFIYYTIVINSEWKNNNAQISHYVKW